MKKSEYIYRVMLIMNEAGLYDIEGNSLLGADTAQVDRHIEGSYVDAWRRCAKAMPRGWFKNDSFKENEIITNLPDGSGYVVLPDDFYLLTSFRMKGWKKDVVEASNENERIASIQANEWTRGSSIRPVCIISTEEVEDNIKQVLKYYSLSKGLDTHEIEKAIYVPVTKPLNEYSDDEDLGLDDQIIEPLAYLSASTVFTMFEKYEIAKALDQRAIEMFPGLSKVKGTSITINQ